MFVLATKLDLNVNDMRELLENSMKENCQKFEELTNKLRMEVDHLSEKINELEAENRGQNERLKILETEASQAAVKHDGLQSDLTCLRDDYDRLVVEEYGARLTSREGGHHHLKENLSQQNKENIDKLGEMVLNMEDMKKKLIWTMGETGKSLEAAWREREEENKAWLAKSFAGVDGRLEEDDKRLSELTNRVEDNTNQSREYQQNNDEKITMMNDILLR